MYPLRFESCSQQWLGTLEVSLSGGLGHIERLTNFTEAELGGVA